MYWNVHKLRPHDPGRRVEALAEVMAKAVPNGPPQIIALSEVGNGVVLNELAALLNERHHGDYDSFMGHSGDPKNWLDSGFLVSRRAVLRMELVAQVRGGAGTRRFVMARCTLTGLGAPTLLLCVNHWWAQGGDAMVRDSQRREVARWLHVALSEERDDYAVVVGDFNVEPHDAVLCATAPLVPTSKGAEFAQPLTTRHLAEAAESRLRLVPLYNTAWRFLQDPLDCSGQPIRCPADCPDGARARGSYLFGDRWFIYDQLLVSGQAVRTGGLTLDERSVHYPAPLVVYDESKGYSLKGWNAEAPGALSDHLPLVARFHIASATGETSG